MASELRLVLIILGALLLGGLFLHGLWTVRKNNNKTPHRYHPEENTKDAPPAEGFDELGVGSVRVVKGGGKKVPEKPRFTTTPRPEAKPQSRPIDLKRRTVPTEQDDLFTAPQDPVLNFSAFDEPQEAPTVADTDADYDQFAETTEQDSLQDQSATEPSEVLILYVLLPEHKEIQGQELLSALTVLGFKYGEMDIFHRHQDSAGNGEVLFSLANMFNPGTFDIHNMDQLTTRGLSLFMTLPGPGEPLQNFNVMNNAAKKLAEEFGGQVLDGQRSVLTVQTVRHYVERIREFQRQRLIRR
ncbi:cell division protein ZipA [Alishewanella tabrizica]|uniref:Cell division protein ZipA n=1 Tax=Alishewanella tabrizica TaxID=671278 RepID=A0ABQ2WDB9_9ALTE|nr:cell division protein ZipA [Alishewanella tabrizica]GGW50027.1 cell division protein ZipA [Alishewanella tabrizica]